MNPKFPMRRTSFSLKPLKCCCDQLVLNAVDFDSKGLTPSTSSLVTPRKISNALRLELVGRRPYLGAIDPCIDARVRT
jgi:hypothetical protein